MGRPPNRLFCQECEVSLVSCCRTSRHIQLKHHLQLCSEASCANQASVDFCNLFTFDKGKMGRSYEIHPRPAKLGTGWSLKLIENGQEAGGGVFPVEEENASAGIAWWNRLTEEKRRHWLTMAASAIPAAARHACLLAEAYNQALDEAEAWVGAKF